MAIAWRLADPRFAEDLEGSGNRIHGARWNSPGRGVLYASENLSLTVLENLVHLPAVLRGHLPPRTALRLEYPDEAEATEIAALPEVARAAKCREMGDRWLDEGKTLILRAPSIVVPQETNLMFNPVHPLMRFVRIDEATPFRFDERLLRT
jgi:RES domain-containing protein